MTQSLFAHDGNRDAGRGEVLLCSGIDDVIFRHIDGAGEDVRRHVGYQRYFHVGVLTQLGSEDGIVGRDVEVVGVFGYGVVFGDIGEVGFFRRCNDIDFAKQFGLFDGIDGPSTCFEVCGFLFQQVERHHAELQAGSAAEIYDIVTGRYV